MIKAIIFDFDGVLCDTFSLALKICKKIDPKFNQEKLKSMFDGNFFKEIKYGFKLERKRKLLKELEFEEYENLKLDKTVKSELEKLSKEFDLFIATSNSNKNLDKFFKNSSFQNKFKKIYTIENSKSKAHNFKSLFKEFNLKPQDCVFITDTLGDILEANKVKLKTIAATFGYHEKERLQKGQPSKIISSFKEIYPTIKKLEY